MIKEIVDGTTCYSEFYTDDEGYTWNILIREGGSVSLYATHPRLGGHGVAWDSLDNKPPNVTAQRVIDHLAPLAEGINALMAALKTAV